MAIKVGRWKKVVFAADCYDCDMCEELICPECEMHYHECDCPGPTQDGIQYKVVGDTLYGREYEDLDDE